MTTYILQKTWKSNNQYLKWLFLNTGDESVFNLFPLFYIPAFFK